MEISNKNIVFNITDNKINGIICNNQTNIIKALSMEENLSKEEKYKHKNNIIIVNDELLNYECNTIYNLLLDTINSYKIYPKNINKKIKDSIKIVGLNEDILGLGLNEVSSSERKLIELAISLITNRDILVLLEPFKIIDLKNKKRIMIILNKLVEKYHKKIVIISDDINVLFSYTEHIIIIKNNKLVIEGDTSKVLTDIDLLKKHHIDIPEIIEITYLAKKMKDVKIDYHKDIRDIIKDIYKHV